MIKLLRILASVFAAISGVSVIILIVLRAEPDKNLPTTSGYFLTSPGSIWVPASSLSIAAGKGSISISYKDGSVTLKDVTLDEAAREFWNKVGEAFPEFSEAVILGYRARKQEENIRTVEWMTTLFQVNGRPGYMGVRSDGVVVWKEIKP